MVVKFFLVILSVWIQYFVAWSVAAQELNNIVEEDVLSEVSSGDLFKELENRRQIRAIDELTPRLPRGKSSNGLGPSFAPADDEPKMYELPRERLIRSRNTKLDKSGDKSIVKELKARVSHTFGKLDIVDLLINTDTKIKKRGEAICIILDKDDVDMSRDASFAYIYGTSLSSEKYCAGQAFATSIRAGRSNPKVAGSGFLVGDNLVITASHVVNDRAEKHGIVIFGFTEDMVVSGVKKFGAIRVAKTQVFSIKKVLAREGPPKRGRGEDWAVVCLDKIVTGRVGLELNSEFVPKSQSLYYLGHPLCLSLKYGSNGKVVGKSHKDHFLTSLDTYPGASGSPIFDEKTHKVVGIVARGKSGTLWTERSGAGEKCWEILRLVDKKDDGQVASRLGPKLIETINKYEKETE